MPRNRRGFHSGVMSDRHVRSGKLLRDDRPRWPDGALDDFDAAAGYVRAPVVRDSTDVDRLAREGTPARQEGAAYVLIALRSDILLTSSTETYAINAVRTTLRHAAMVMGLDLAQVEWAIEEHGRCDTDNFILIPLET